MLGTKKQIPATAIGVLCAVLAGCGVETDLGQAGSVADGKSDAGYALDYSIEVAKGLDGRPLTDAAGNQLLRVTLINTAWSARYVSNCGIWISRVMPGAPDDGGFIPPMMSPAGCHPVPLTEAEYPRFCVDEHDQRAKRLEWTFAAAEKKTLSFLIPTPAYAWSYQINIPFGRSASADDEVMTRALTIPLYDYDEKAPQVVLDSSSWPAAGVVQLGEGEAWTLEAISRNAPSDHFHLVIEQDPPPGTTQAQLRAVYTIDPANEALTVEGAPSPLFTVELLRAYGGRSSSSGMDTRWINIDLIAKGEPGSTATVHLEASGAHATGRHPRPTRRVTSNAWPVRLLGAPPSER